MSVPVLTPDCLTQTALPQEALPSRLVAASARSPVEKPVSLSDDPLKGPGSRDSRSTMSGERAGTADRRLVRDKAASLSRCTRAKSSRRSTSS